jgi:hypothetical protein
MSLRLAFHELALHNAVNMSLSNKFIKTAFTSSSDLWDASSEEYENLISVLLVVWPHS